MDKKEEKLLSWRPGKFTKDIPSDVYEARMNLLNPDDRKELERAFSLTDGGFKKAFFGTTSENSTEDWQQTAVGCAAFAHDDPDKAMRFFKASASFDRERQLNGTHVFDGSGSPTYYDADKKYRSFMTQLISYTKQIDSLTQSINNSPARFADTDAVLSR